MKSFIFLVLLAFAAAEEEYYVLGKIDLSDIGNNIGELKKFMECLLEKAPCSDLYDSYRVRVSESFKTACKKCTPEQKQFVSQFFEVVKKYLPQDHDDFLRKYDPESKYINGLLAEVNKYKA